MRLLWFFFPFFLGNFVKSNWVGRWRWCQGEGKRLRQSGYGKFIFWIQAIHFCPIQQRLRITVRIKHSHLLHHRGSYSNIQFIAWFFFPLTPFKMNTKSLYTKKYLSQRLTSHYWMTWTTSSIFLIEVCITYLTGKLTKQVRKICFGVSLQYSHRL